MELYLIRHGQTDWNREKRIQGTEDIPLNDTGRHQAAVCAQALSALPFEAIYTSPLSRAVETARIISDACRHAPVILEPGLTERDFGIGSGLTYEELHRRYPQYPKLPLKGMEEFEPLCRRILHTVLRCAEKSHTGPVLLVSHGSSINALLYQLSGGACGTGITTLQNTCISKLSYAPRESLLSLVYYNISPYEQEGR